MTTCGVIFPVGGVYIAELIVPDLIGVVGTGGLGIGA